MNNKIKPKLLLHICCAPDSTASFERLRTRFEVIGFFHNPNIYPEEEYLKRMQETQKVADKMGFELLIPEYRPEEWLEAVQGLENEPEKGKRCEICFRFNLQATARKAQELGIPHFTTTLSISPHKDSELIFKLGEEAAKEFEVELLRENFKKKDGFKQSLVFAKKLGLYRQNYCGCRFSQRNETSQT